MKKMLMVIGLLAVMSLACKSAIAPADNARQAVYKMSVTATQSAPVMKRLCGNVNVRGVPAAEGSVQGWLRYGEYVLVYETRGGWARVGAGQWITLAEVCNE